MAATFSRWRQAVLWMRHRIFRDRAARWDHQYVTGRWEKLKGPAEQERFSATAQLLTRHVPPGRVLEIGCGEGVLLRHLIPADFNSWTGVDISAVAVHRAQALAGERVRFLVGDMETFEPEGKFDCIVFTESIYYAADSGQVLRRFARSLSPGGRFVVSIFRTKRSERIWARIHAVADTVERVATTNGEGTWECEVLVPGAAEQPD